MVSGVLLVVLSGMECGREGCRGEEVVCFVLDGRKTGTRGAKLVIKEGQLPIRWLQIGNGENFRGVAHF